MKYPIFSNWITYKRLSDQNAYYVKDYVLDTRNIVSSEKMKFARKLDGRTNPYSIKENRTLSETKALIEELECLGVIRNDRGVISDGEGFYMRTIVRTRNTRLKRAISRFLNVLLMVMFVPVLLVGIYVYLHADAYGYGASGIIEKLVYEHPVICMWTFNIFSIVCGGAIHELCHGIACRAYGGKVFEYGAMINILPGFYTLMDESRVKTRLAKIQVLAAGVEGNILLAGCLFLMAGAFPSLRYMFSVGAFVNLIMTFINMLAIDGTDGMKIILLLIGMDSKDIEEIKSMTREIRKREILENDGYYGYAKLTACYMIIWLQRIYPLLILLDLVAIIGAFI